MAATSWRPLWLLAFLLTFAFCLLTLFRERLLLAFVPAADGSRLRSAPAPPAAAAAAAAAALAAVNASAAAAYGCLRRTTPRLELAYPADAVEHTREIHEALGTWIGGMPNGTSYSGMWMERHWMAQYNLSAILSDASGKALRDNFGPYLPLLVPWTEIWVAGGHNYPEDLMPAVRKVLRRDVPYVTISQSALGLVGKCNQGFNHRNFPVILVFSAGGYGHVPIPLLEMRNGLREKTTGVMKASELKYLVSFLGSSTTAPFDMRLRMCKAARRMSKILLYQRVVGDVLKAPAKWLGWSSEESGPRFSVPGLKSKKPIFCKKRNDWLHIGEISRASLAPRGYGRTSYRLFEIMRYGLIPVYIYDDLPWVPYPDMP